MHEPILATQGKSRGMILALAAAATLIALVSARPYAGSWNDGSRLASVEAIVDYHTLAIDDSIFLAPIFLQDGVPSPYTPGDELLNLHGTLDRLLINVHWYSDKPYVPQVILAGVYKAAQVATGLQANTRPDLFAWLMTVASSGVALVAFAVAAFIVARRILRSDKAAVLLAIAFTLGSAALPYARHVNAHLPLAAAVMAIIALLVCSLSEAGELDLRARRTAIIGLLAGFAYAQEPATGALLCLSLGLLMVWQGWWRDRARWPLPFVLTLTALPFIALHHVFNYRIGGTLGPANAVPSYLNWPGSPFAGGALTGQWNHESILRGAVYTLELLVGRKGFLWLNPPMMLGLVAAVRLQLPARLRVAAPGARRGERALLCCLFGWAAAVWLMYGALSRNQSGLCYSVRWFVPMLGPGLLAVALLLRQQPRMWREFAVFAVAGLLLAIVGWWLGPWQNVRGYMMWPVVGVMLVAWGVIALRGHRAKSEDTAGL